jgi:hypothetical protein
MKKLLVALALASTAVSASAITVNSGLLYVDNAVETPLIQEWGPVGDADYAIGDIAYAGTLKSVASGTFTATYLGQKAGFANRYMAMGNTLVGAGRPTQCNDGSCANVQTGVGLTSTIWIAAETAIDFAFFSDNNGDLAADALTTVENGDPLISGSKSRGILFFMNTFGLKDGSGKLFDFLVGYDDNNSDNDFDDFVVGVRAVPVPAALPLLASAFAAFGIARRKNKQA